MLSPKESGGTTEAPIGKTIALKSSGSKNYVNATTTDAHRRLMANSTASTATAQQFTVVDAGGGLIALKSKANSKYVCADKQLDVTNWNLAANRTAIGAWEKFTWVANSDGTVSLKANGNGKYVCADKNLGSIDWPLAANRTAIGGWEKFTVEIK